MNVQPVTRYPVHAVHSTREATHLFVCVVALSCVVMAAPLPAAAQSAKALEPREANRDTAVIDRQASSLNASFPAPARTPGVSALIDAHRLARQAHGSGDAVALLQAAEIVLDWEQPAPPRPVTRYPYVLSGVATQVPGDDTASKLLDEAEVLAVDDVGLLEAIETLRSETRRGRINGPLVTHGELPPSGTDVYRVPFQGAEPAHLFLRTMEDSLGLSVFDEHLNVVCEALIRDAVAECLFLPLRTAVFRVHVSNSGDHTLSYDLVTN